MAKSESEKKMELDKVLRLTHPKTIKRVESMYADAKGGGDDKRAAFLSNILDQADKREQNIEEYIKISKLQAMAIGDVVDEEELRELIDEREGDLLLEHQLSQLS